MMAERLPRSSGEISYKILHTLTRRDGVGMTWGQCDAYKRHKLATVSRMTVTGQNLRGGLMPLARFRLLRAILAYWRAFHLRWARRCLARARCCHVLWRLR
jgi:hypothetical protein